MLQEISYTAQGRSFNGFLADGAGRDQAPGVLVLHGGGGIGAQAKERAEMLAGAGYVAYAPDLFGEPVDGVEHAKTIVAHYTENWAELRSRCGGALAVLKNRANVDASRTAAIGFCFGGQAALELGRSGIDLSAIVGFHSQLATNRPQDSANIKARVLVCLGNRDCFVSGREREAFLENMTENEVDCQLLVFAGVGHSFTDPHAAAANIPGIAYDKQADQRSWQAMMAFFNEVFAA